MATLASQARRFPIAGATGAAAAALAVAAGRAARLAEVPAVETFVLIFTSIVVEALPFVLMGALVSAAIAVYVPDRAFARVARLPLALQVPAAAFGGVAFPVCECGSVPVARRLIGRGMHPAAGIAFMLASPILNPIVLASTFVAYRGRGVAGQMVAGRAALGLAVAIVAGWALGERATVRPSSRRDHGGGLMDHLSSDLIFMGRYVVLGAAIAAALQTLVPQGVVSGVARTPVVGSLALMGLAFVLSLCSEADAFVAVSLVQFPLGAQLGFLVLGPVADVKLSLLYAGAFAPGFVARLLVVAVPVVLAGSLWFEVAVG